MRVLLDKPNVIIFDESTLSLDHNTETKLLDALDEYIKNKTVITIAHRQTTIDKSESMVSKGGEMKRKHYIIGDVHGEFDMLISLVSKLPKDAKLIFVGDLINRGAKSREVIEFVRNNAFAVVQGNHECYILENANFFLESIEIYRRDRRKNFWSRLNGTEVLRSYGLVTDEIDDAVYILDKPLIIEQLKEDLAWMESLPCYLELGEFEGYDLPIVVTHGSAGDFWHLKDENFQAFKEVCQSNREVPSQDTEIFNIYGHVVYSEVKIGKNYVCVDTGSGKTFDRARLSAYCVETKEVFES